MKYVILAGGNGTRLFPLSREILPKQFLKLFSEKSLLQETISRINSKNFVIISSESSSYKIKSQLEEINRYKKEKIMLEPFGRNTAPAIIYSLVSVEDDEIVCVLPSDHYINNKENFIKTIEKAAETAGKGYITTIGITPQYPETGYGYIKQGKKLDDGVFLVDRFVEKPNIEKAKIYFQSNEYFWNAGMFVFKKSDFIKELKKYSLDMYDFYVSLKKTNGNREKIKKLYKEIRNISIDYALMEKSSKIAVVRAEFEWSDIGNFKSLKEILSKESNLKNENFGQFKKVLSYSSENNLVFSEKPVIGLININNLAIIDTKDVLLISDINSSQKVKNFYNDVKNKNTQITKAHPDEERPWGKFSSLLNKDNFKVKWIEVKNGEKLSLQYHNHREEHWVITKGRAIMTLGNKEFEVKKGDYINIKIKQLHTIEALEDTEFIEVQIGDYLGEDDIVRIEDKYNRI